MISKKFFIILLFLLVSRPSFSQEPVDTVFFYSHFKCFVKNIEIEDLNNNNSIILTNHEGKTRIPKSIIFNSKTDSVRITVNFRFRSNYIEKIISVNDIKEKFVFIWIGKKEIQIAYQKKWRGII